MISLKPVRRSTLGEQIAFQILQLISKGGLKPGDKLPPETDLCKILGVGRSTLREALRSLAFVGIVRMRAGEGTYVSDSQERLIENVLSHGLLNTEQEVNNLAEARICTETELARLCAERATSEEVQMLGNILEKQLRCIEEEREGEFLELDLEFHLNVAKGSKNPVLAQFLKTIRNLLREYIYKSHQLHGGRKRAYDYHFRIFEAIKQRDGRKARRAMRDHLIEFQQRYALLHKASEPTSQKV